MLFIYHCMCALSCELLECLSIFQLKSFRSKNSHIILPLSILRKGYSDSHGLHSDPLKYFDFTSKIYLLSMLLNAKWVHFHVIYFWSDCEFTRQRDKLQNRERINQNNNLLRAAIYIFSATWFMKSLFIYPKFLFLSRCIAKCVKSWTSVNVEIHFNFDEEMKHEFVLFDEVSRLF